MYVEEPTQRKATVRREAQYRTLQTVLALKQKTKDGTFNLAFFVLFVLAIISMLLRCLLLCCLPTVVTNDKHGGRITKPRRCAVIYDTQTHKSQGAFKRCKKHARDFALDIGSSVCMVGRKQAAYSVSLAALKSTHHARGSISHPSNG